jgi:hypothetical protein
MPGLATRLGTNGQSEAVRRPPRTDWLRECLALDQQGFILTGRDLDPILESAPQKWPVGRPPQMLETSLHAVLLSEISVPEM